MRNFDAIIHKERKLGASKIAITTLSCLFHLHVLIVGAVRSRPGIDPGTVDATSMRSPVER